MTSFAGPGLTEDLRGFPPGRTFLAIPRSPRQAARSALALDETLEPRQQLLLFGARFGLTRLLRPIDAFPDTFDAAWWEAWVSEVAAPLIGAPATCAFRIPPNGRTATLLMDARGLPPGFAKTLGEEQSHLAQTISQVLAGGGRAARAPLTLAVGQYAGVPYCLETPVGVHRRPPHRPDQLANVVDWWQAALRDLPRPAGLGKDAVVCHGDFTPRNLRLASNGELWLFDWDDAGWGPRLADELQYWCADFSWRMRSNPKRDARKVLEILLRRGTLDEVADAAAWPDAPSKVYRGTERDLWLEVARLAEGAGA